MSLRGSLAMLEPDHLPARILRHVVVTESGCWRWTGDRYWTGYGRVKYLGQRHRAHRLAYTLLAGPIPEGHVLHHRCHDADLSCPSGTECVHRACIRPSHLQPMTNSANLERRARRNEAMRLAGLS